MTADIRQVIDVDGLIHQPARLLIMTILYPIESADFLYLLRESGLTKGNLSAHLAKLEEAGYLEIEKTYRGKTPLTVCQLTAAGREPFGSYREQLQTILKYLPE